MNIYYALSSGKWSVYHRADWPIFMRVGGVNIKEGEEEIQFTLDLKVIHRTSNSYKTGHYVVDGSAYQNHTGPIVIIITMDGEETVRWNIDKFELQQTDDHTIGQGELWISYIQDSDLSVQWEHIIMMKHIKE